MEGTTSSWIGFTNKRSKTYSLGSNVGVKNARSGDRSKSPWSSHSAHWSAKIKFERIRLTVWNWRIVLRIPSSAAMSVVLLFRASEKSSLWGQCGRTRRVLNRIVRELSLIGTSCQSWSWDIRIGQIRHRYCTRVHSQLWKKHCTMWLLYWWPHDWYQCRLKRTTFSSISVVDSFSTSFGLNVQDELFRRKTQRKISNFQREFVQWYWRQVLSSLSSSISTTSDIMNFWKRMFFSKHISLLMVNVFQFQMICIDDVENIITFFTILIIVSVTIATIDIFTSELIRFFFERVIVQRDIDVIYDSSWTIILIPTSYHDSYWIQVICRRKLDCMTVLKTSRPKMILDFCQFCSFRFSSKSMSLDFTLMFLSECMSVIALDLCRNMSSFTLKLYHFVMCLKWIENLLEVFVHIEMIIICHSTYEFFTLIWFTKNEFWSTRNERQVTHFLKDAKNVLSSLSENLNTDVVSFHWLSFFDHGVLL